jgi:KipI family sensor histidine kinase inhibitor
MHKVRRMGDAALLVELGSQDAAHQLHAAVLASQLPGIEEVVVGARTVLVRLDPGRIGRPGSGGSAELMALLANPGGVQVRGDGEEAGLLEVPVAYDGPDLVEVAGSLGLSVEEVVRRHTAPVYRVGFVGFSPGFAYLTGLDPSLVLPRRAVPRTRVPAGSVGIGGEHTGIYPQATPGGWQLLGSTSFVAFDAGKWPPSPFVPGRRVRFVAGSRGQVQPGSTPASGPPPRITPLGGTLLVLRAGPLTTIQDRGRTGFAAFGVPRAGALDLPSLCWANELVGNAPEAAGLELTALGPELRAEAGCVLALTGGTVAATLDGEAIPMNRPIAMPAGTTLSVGPVKAGVRTYVGIAGGIGVPPVLGSRSADTLSGLGPAPLRDGDRISFGQPGAGQPGAGAGPGASQPGAGAGPGASQPGAGAGPGAGGVSHPSAGDARTVQVLMGPRDDWFTAGSVTTLLSSEWQVSPACDRAGARLVGPSLARVDPGAELLPEPMVPGAIQVPPNGQPIVLLANHPTTGGYPVIAVVATADIAAIAQARPGDKVCFCAVPDP